MSYGPLGLGEVKLWMCNSGYWAAVREVQIPAGGAPVAVQVRKTGTMVMHAKDADGDPVAGVVVDLRSTEHAEWASTWIHAGQVPWPPNGTITDASGHLRAEGLPHGEYTVRVLAGGSADGQVIQVPPHRTVEFDLTVH